MKNSYLLPMMLSLFFSALFFTPSLCPAEVTVDIPAGKDNTLYENPEGSLSNGAGDFMFVGRTGQAQDSIRRGLLAFAIGDSIPAGATIQSATLTLYMSKTPVTTDRMIELHRILADWGEGESDAPGEEGGGGLSMTGDATWFHTFYDTSFWTTVGGDYSTMVTASQAVGATGYYTWDSTAEMVADVQDWLDNPMNNFGWLLLGDESEIATSKRFNTRENPTADTRPVLTVTYMEPSGIDDFKNDIPRALSLAQNYPNPFNPTTTIQYTLQTDSRVTLKIYNVHGQEIKTLVNENQTAGPKSIVWDGKNNNGQSVSSGVYLYRMTAGEYVRSHKMVLLK